MFVPAADADVLLAALPARGGVPADSIATSCSPTGRPGCGGTTPVDLFLDTTPFHSDVGRRVRTEPFAGHEIPFLSCRDLAVFKAFFDRTKDWADLEEMQAAGTLDIEAVAGVLVRYLGADDHRIARLLSLDGYRSRRHRDAPASPRLASPRRRRAGTTTRPPPAP